MSQNHKHQGKLGISLALLTAILSGGILNAPAEAATLKQGVFLTGEIIENSLIFTQNSLNFEKIVAEAFISIESNALQFSLSNLDTAVSPQASITFDSVMNSLSQLRFDAPDLNAVAEIDVLSPTSAEQIMRGVYDFELPSLVTPNTDVFVFEDTQQVAVSRPTYTRPIDALPTLSVLNAPGSGLALPFYGLMGGGGLTLPVYGGARLFAGGATYGNISPVSVAAGPIQRDSIRAEFMRVWQENVDARFDMYPDEIRVEMPGEAQGGLSDTVSQLEQSMDLNVDVALRTMPEDIFLTPLDLKDDYVKTSPMLNRDYARARLAVTENFRSYLQENAQERQQELVEYQRGLQQRLYERNKALRERRQQNRQPQYR